MLDTIVVLNLDKRIGHQDRIKAELSKVGLSAEFFVAGKGEILDRTKYALIDVEPPVLRRGYPAWVNRPNSYNAFLCFKEIIRKAKEDKLESITLMEDDCTLRDNFAEIVTKAREEVKELPQWDMFYFCSCHAWTKTRLLSDHVLKLSGSGGFQLVSIRWPMYDIFLEAPLVEPIDSYAGKLHKDYNCYGIWPNVAIPLPGYSECEGYEYDNTKLYDIRGC